MLLLSGHSPRNQTGQSLLNFGDSNENQSFQYDLSVSLIQLEPCHKIDQFEFVLGGTLIIFIQSAMTLKIWPTPMKGNILLHQQP